MRPPGEAGWFGQGGAATMAAIKRRDLADLLADLLAGQTDRHGDRPSSYGSGWASVKGSS